MSGMDIKLHNPIDKYAFFFDLDGVLADLVDSPDQTVINETVLTSLGNLNGLSNGAVAIISGRQMTEIKQLTAPLVLHASGLHGLQMSIGETYGVGWSDKLDAIRPQLAVLAEQFPGILIEDKQHCIAVHYRLFPEARYPMLEMLNDFLELLGDEFILLCGKMVYEFKPAHINKARAVESFLELPEFNGKTPVYLGDDITDEDAFIFVNKQNGISVKVGESGQTAAREKLPSTDAVQDWLAKITD